jgi:signal transduction histidine kinase
MHRARAVRIAMSVGVRTVLLVLALAAVLSAPAGVGATGRTVELLPGSGAPAIPPRVDVLKDPGGALGIADVVGGDARFTPNRSARINFGLDAPVVWLRLPVRNVGAAPGRWVLSLNRALLPVVELHLVSVGRRHLLLSGARGNDVQRSYERYGTLAAAFELPPRTGGTLYIRYRGGASNLLPTIEAPDRFEAGRRQLHYVYFAVLAGVLTLSLYSAVTFGATGLRPYLYFVLGQLTLLAYFSHLAGFTTVYLWPAQPQRGAFAAALLFTAYNILMLQFARSLFATADRSRRLDAVLAGLLGFGLLQLGLAVAGSITGYPPLGVVNGLTLPAGVATWLVLPVLAVYATLAWKRSYWPLAVAWMVLAAMIVYTAGSLLGLLPTIPGFLEIYAGLVYVEALLMSLVLVLHVRDLRRQSFAAVESELAASRRSEQLAQQKAVALLELAEKGRLLRAAGHDTRQMLYSLRHFVSGLSGAAGRARLEEARESIGRLADHLDDVLATTIDAGHSGGIDDRLVALDTIPAASLLNPMRLIHERAAIAKGLRYRSRPSDVQIVSDRVLVMRIVSNLVDNAIKYTAAGGVLLAARQAGDDVRLQVWDSGRGLDATQRDRLLDAADRPQRFAADEAGLGSGLITAKALAARLGGQLNACSRLGHGSRFELVLPAPRPLDDQYPTWLIVGADGNFRTHAARLAREVGATRVAAADALHGRHDDIDAASVVVVDADELALDQADHALLAPWRRRMIVATYDRSAEMRANLARSCDVLLYKPITAAGLQRALACLAPDAGDASQPAP